MSVTLSSALQPLLLCSGRPLRLVSAKSSSCFSLIESYMLLEAPFNALFRLSPRLAERAAPAAFCWAFEVAGMVGSLAHQSADKTLPQRGRFRQPAAALKPNPCISRRVAKSGRPEVKTATSG